MQGILVIWLELAACLVVIGVAGTALSRYGDVIGSKAGLSGNWIGVILLATVTSLPELATGLSAATIGEAPNIAVGNVLGSCLFNFLMLAVLDTAWRERPFFSELSDGHALSAAFAILLFSVVGIGVAVAPQLTAAGIGHVGATTPVLAASYACAMWTVFVRERAANGNSTGELIDRYPEVTLRAAVSRYALAALFVIAAGTWLPFIGKDLSAAMGWSTGLVGTFFIAVVTWTPELVVTATALRIGAIEMAAGNLLGSSLFNMLILAIDDVAYTPGPLLGSVETSHAATAFAAAAMAAVVIVALLVRPQRRYGWLPGVPSLAIIAIYAVNAWILFAGG
jgi:cation:H+ antiporter